MNTVKKGDTNNVLHSQFFYSRRMCGRASFFYWILLIFRNFSLSDIIEERMARDPEDFYDWLDREIQIATNTYLEWHINEHAGHLEDLE